MATKLIDLKGKRFGKLKVLQQAKNRGIRVYWLVACDCGSDPYEIESYGLRNDCRQCPECSRLGVIKDLKRKQFGEWTVIRQTERPQGSKHRGAFWLAQCSCGSNPRVMRADYFTNKGSATDCGCVYIEGRQDIIGQIFGRLTVKRWLGHRRYLCKCSCDNGHCEVEKQHLVSGMTQSCGCLQVALLLQRKTGSRGFAGLTGIDHPNWNGGSSFFPHPPEFNKLLK
ncbi:MAG TPA: hypothetical protein ENH60_00755, partial [Pricia sp.]|nr:hypothetical protein [Pricia sp.]